MELNVQKPLRKYEAVIILNPDATEGDQKAFFQKQKEILKSYKGDFHHVDTWGKRRLANPIGKFHVGTYFHTTFEAEAESISELERTMRIDEKVLRFMHTRLDERVSLSKHLEQYRTTIKNSTEREKEKAAAKAKKQQARQQRT